MEWLVTGLGMGAATASLLAAGWGLVRLTASWWRRSIGLRHHQQDVLDHLACGSSVRYVESLFGAPQFLNQADALTERVYRLAGGWLVIYEVDRAVQAFSITIVDPRLYFRTKLLTFGHLDLRLGRDTFVSTRDEPAGQHRWTGARRMGYLQEYYFGNPAGYQHYWISFNDAGCGSVPPAADFCTGTYGDETGPTADVSSITVNTLTILAPGVDPTQMRRRRTLGVDLDMVRLSRK